MNSVWRLSHLEKGVGPIRGKRLLLLRANARQLWIRRIQATVCGLVLTGCLGMSGTFYVELCGHNNHEIGGLVKLSPEDGSHEKK